MKTKEEIKIILRDSINGFMKLSVENQNSLVHYYESVELLADKSANIEFTNKDNFCGAIVMAKIYSSSTKDVRIFCKNLKGEICDNPIYINALKSYLDKHKPIKVIFEGEPENSECFKMLKAASLSDTKFCQLYKLDKNYKDKARNLGIKLFHFLISDGQRLRYEYNGDTYQATCNFDDKDSVAALNENFTSMLNFSTPL